MANDGVSDHPGQNWLRLSSGDAGSLFDVPAGWSAPDRVGPYQILAEIGRGGMGVVYKARDTRLGRVVALKMLLAGGHADGEARRRFLTEASALARLTHPNIVPVFEVGEHGGLPYFSMELIDGEPLSAHLTRGPLPPEAAAALVEEVARAVHHAHQQGVIHRDLKPANVLIDEHGRPHVGDFGVARLIEQDERVTRPGQLVGTPVYLAPELLATPHIPAGPGADVYSLGVILYELLAGRTPFVGSSIADLLDQLTFHNPIPLNQLRRGLPAELETVVLRCLERDPKARFASAAELADELHRFRQGQPVLSRPQGVLRRAGRWAWQHPMVATLSVAAVLLIGAALAVLGTGLHAARTERDRALADLERAERRERRTRRAAVLMTAAVADELLIGPLEAPPARRAFLEMAASEYAELADEGPSALAATLLGSANRRLGRLAAAEAAYRQAIRHDEALPHPDAADRRRLAVTLGNLGGLLVELGRADEADGLYGRAIELTTELEGPPPGDVRMARLRALLLAARAQAQAERPADAAASYAAALRDVQERLVRDGSAGDVRPELAATYAGLGAVEFRRGTLGPAEKNLREALKLWGSGLDRPEVRDAVAGCRSDLGSLLVKTGRTVDGLKEHERAVELAERLVTESPLAGRYRLRLASCLAAQATVMRAEERAAALTALDRATGLLDGLRAEFAADRRYRDAVRMAHVRRAYLRAATGRLDEGLADCGRALEVSRGSATLMVRSARLTLLTDGGRHADAIRDLEELRADRGLSAAALYDYGRRSATFRDRRTTPEAFHEAYAALAVGLLHRANEAGYFAEPGRRDRLRREEAFAALRGRDDWMRLEAALPAGPGKDR